MWEITYCVIDLWCLRQNHFLCRSRSYHRGIGVLGRSALSIERGQPVGVEVRSCQVILRSRASAPLHRPGRWGNTTVAPSWYCNNLSFTEGLFLVAPHWATRAWTWESAKDIYRPRHHHHLLPAACCLSDIRYCAEPWVKITVKWIRKWSALNLQRTWESVSYFHWGLKWQEEG